MVCKLCGAADSSVIHNGCRDDASINVLRCNKCGLVYLDSQSQVTDAMYEDFGMEQGEDFSYDAWLQRTNKDDVRRAGLIMDILDDRKIDRIDICDFGCGNGGFLRKLIQSDRQRFSCYGVDLKKIARYQNEADGIPCRKAISDYKNQKFDVITMFHVIEHLTEPDTFLRSLADYLNENGMIILETPNADEALLKQYHCSAYADFTYWSEHVYLYTSATLADMVTKAGYEIVSNTQIQRYSFLNHIYWLTKGKPGGHITLQEYVSPELDSFYSDSLRDKGECDTLFMVIKKG